MSKTANTENKQAKEKEDIKKFSNSELVQENVTTIVQNYQSEKNNIGANVEHRKAVAFMIKNYKEKFPKSTGFNFGASNADNLNPYAKELYNTRLKDIPYNYLNACHKLSKYVEKGDKPNTFNLTFPTKEKDKLGFQSIANMTGSRTLAEQFGKVKPKAKTKDDAEKLKDKLLSDISVITSVLDSRNKYDLSFIKKDADKDFIKSQLSGMILHVLKFTNGGMKDLSSKRTTLLQSIISNDK